MKITSINPLIVSKNAEEKVKLFEALGFKQIHNPEDLNENNASDTVLENQAGFRIDVAQVNDPLPKDLTFIRINVDNFKEAYDILLANGFRNTRGDDTLDSSSSKAATMVSESGLTIALVQHIQ